MTDLSILFLESLAARASGQKTVEVPAANLLAMVETQALLQNLRAHESFDEIVESLRIDWIISRGVWADAVAEGDDKRADEQRSFRMALELVHRLVTGETFAVPSDKPTLRLVKT